MSPLGITAAASPPSLGAAAPVLFADRGCPFSHRVMALLDHLGWELDLRESPVGESPPGVEHYSASKCLPVLIHGEVALTESRVMLEHLAEHYGFTAAYPADLAARTLHRQAMAVVDATLAPLLRRTARPAEAALIEDALTAIEGAIATVPPEPGLMAFHIAPIWQRFRWWHPQGAITRLVETRPTLCSWLDAVVRLDCVARTAPDLAAHLADVALARQAGLIP